MADISNINLPNGENYDIKDKVARNDIALNRTTLGTQCKNLLKNTAVTKTVNGVTFTVNDDSTITANGTATSRIIFLVGTAYISQTGNYTYTGTPSGGASATYSMNYRNSNVYKDVDTGNGTTAQFEGGKTYEAVIDIRSGVTISNLTFKPMLRYADITDSTYKPYSDNVDTRLTKNKSDIAVNKTTLGYQCKNLFNPNAVNWYQPTKTSIAKDGTITSTTTSDSRIWSYENAEYFLTLSAGKYIVRTITETIDNTASNIISIRGYNESGTQLFDIYPNKIGTKTKSFTITETTTIAIMFKLFTQTCKIMVYDADITDDTYEPYQPSVKEQIIGTYFPMTNSKGLANNTDLNTITEIGNYACYTGGSAATMTNCPTKAGGFRLIVTNLIVSTNESSTIRYQWIIPNNLDGILCFRRKFDISTNTFNSWYSFGGTVVS